MIDSNKKHEDGKHEDVESYFGNVISSYTREMALADGVLVDMKQGALEEIVRAHFKIPTACTSAVWDIIERAVAAEGFGNDLNGVVHDVCWMARFPVKKISPSTILYDVIITGANDSKNFDTDDNTYRFKLVCGPGDDAEPVITIMLPEED